MIDRPHPVDDATLHGKEGAKRRSHALGLVDRRVAYRAQDGEWKHGPGCARNLAEISSDCERQHPWLACKMIAGRPAVGDSDVATVSSMPSA